MMAIRAPFRARLALTLTDAADRDRWDDEHREAVADVARSVPVLTSHILTI